MQGGLTHHCSPNGTHLPVPKGRAGCPWKPSSHCISQLSTSGRVFLHSCLNQVGKFSSDLSASLTQVPRSSRKPQTVHVLGLEECSDQGTPKVFLYTAQNRDYCTLASQGAGHFERIRKTCCLCVTQPAGGTPNMTRPKTGWSKESRLGWEKYNLAKSQS